MALTKHETAVAVSEITGLGTQSVKNVLTALAQVAEQEVAAGNDFIVPGVCKVRWTYRSAKKKGERWSKGEEVQGFGGSIEVKDSDSPPITAKARLIASPNGAVGKLKPKTADMSSFLKTRAGKALATRLGR